MSSRKMYTGHQYVPNQMHKRLQPTVSWWQDPNSVWSGEFHFYVDNDRGEGKGGSGHKGKGRTPTGALPCVHTTVYFYRSPGRDALFTVHVQRRLLLGWGSSLTQSSKQWVMSPGHQRLHAPAGNGNLKLHNLYPSVIVWPPRTEYQ